VSPQSKYIYGIVEEPQPRSFSLGGVGGAGVHTINYQKLAAIVSDTEFSEIDPTRKNVQAHTAVQDELLKEYTLLPTGFGMIAGDENEVRGLLENNYRGLINELERLAGRIEVELKLYWDHESMTRELQLAGSHELADIRTKLDAASSPLEKRDLLEEVGRMVESIALDWKSRYAGPVYHALKALSCEARENSPAGVKDLLNASFLIDRSREDEFKERVYKLDVEFQGKVNFKYVGPLPPYNFIDLRLEGVRC
jgi:hypothetical protein